MLFISVGVYAECPIYKDPDTNTVTEHWPCISKQRDTYRKARAGKRWQEAVDYAPWSAMEAWTYLQWARTYTNGKKTKEISVEDLFQAKDLCLKALTSCNKAEQVNLCVREAKKCAREVNAYLLFVKRCLGEEPWPTKKKKKG